MKRIVCLILLSLFICLSGQSQVTTNIAPFRYLHTLRILHENPTNCYGSRETVVEFAPTISSINLFNPSSSHTYGYSLEIEHWTSQNLGTGFEMGSYDYRNGIDHFAVMEDYRYIPFQQYYFWNRLAIGGKTGAETYLVDGSKAMEIGGEIYWHFSQNVRFEFDITEHIRSSNKSGQTARFALQYLF